MKRGGQVGAELHGQCDRDFSGQVGGIIQNVLLSVTSPISSKVVII